MKNIKLFPFCKKRTIFADEHHANDSFVDNYDVREYLMYVQLRPYSHETF
jgi:hypothetical protein